MPCSRMFPCWWSRTRPSCLLNLWATSPCTQSPPSDRPLPVFGGLSLAFTGKMLAAVLFGKAILRVPGHWTSVFSALAFFACAFFVWFKEPKKTSLEGVREPGWLRAAAISFSSLFFTEWCDTGQIAAAALAAHTL